MEMSHDHPVLITLPQINRFSQSYVDHLELKTFIDLCRVKIPFSGGNISCIIVLCNLGKLASLTVQDASHVKLAIIKINLRLRTNFQ